MKHFFIFALFFLVGVLGIITYGILQKNPGKPVTSIIQTVAKPNFDIAVAPSESIRGSIKQMTGDVFWQSRTATESSQIPFDFAQGHGLQQGEEIQTKENGNLTIEFPNVTNVVIAPKTQIDFVQTLPTEFVMSIASGSANFKKLSETPVGIRSYHLLVRQNSGEIGINVDTEKGFTNLNIISGSVTVAYNDLNLDSHVVDFQAGKKVSFNDGTRTIVAE